MLQYTKAEIEFIVTAMKQTADGLLDAKEQTTKDKASFGNDIDKFLDIMATYDQMLRHCESIAKKSQEALDAIR